MRKPVPGYRFFKCDTCGNEWRERSRDCETMSISDCIGCGSLVTPVDYEAHPEWPTDKFGNLVEEPM